MATETLKDVCDRIESRDGLMGLRDRIIADLKRQRDQSRENAVNGADDDESLCLGEVNGYSRAIATVDRMMTSAALFPNA